jgi:hypothetical protein
MTEITFPRLEEMEKFYRHQLTPGFEPSGMLKDILFLIGECKALTAEKERLKIVIGRIHNIVETWEPKPVEITIAHAHKTTDRSEAYNSKTDDWDRKLDDIFSGRLLP